MVVAKRDGRQWRTGTGAAEVSRAEADSGGTHSRPSIALL